MAALSRPVRDLAQSKQQGQSHCHWPGCERTASFSRPAELNRHRKDIHEVGVIDAYHCPHEECNDGRAWQRRDKFREHLRNQHQTKDIEAVILRCTRPVAGSKLLDDEIDRPGKTISKSGKSRRRRRQTPGIKPKLSPLEPPKDLVIKSHDQELHGIFTETGEAVTAANRGMQDAQATQTIECKGLEDNKPPEMEQIATTNEAPSCEDSRPRVDSAMGESRNCTTSHRNTASESSAHLVSPQPQRRLQKHIDVLDEDVLASDSEPAPTHKVYPEPDQNILELAITPGTTTSGAKSGYVARPPQYTNNAANGYAYDRNLMPPNANINFTGQTGYINQAPENQLGQQHDPVPLLSTIASDTRPVPGFPCVFHRGGSPSQDITAFCHKRKQFVSQLGPHHGRRFPPHPGGPFFYCTRCFQYGTSDEALHDHYCQFVCVTDGCFNYALPAPNHEQPCLHGNENDQRSIWRKLYRVRHNIPDHDPGVPDPSDAQSLQDHAWRLRTATPMQVPRLDVTNPLQPAVAQRIHAPTAAPYVADSSIGVHRPDPYPVEDERASSVSLVTNNQYLIEYMEDIAHDLLSDITMRQMHARPNWSDDGRTNWIAIERFLSSTPPDSVSSEVALRLERLRSFLRPARTILDTRGQIPLRTWAKFRHYAHRLFEQELPELPDWPIESSVSMSSANPSQQAGAQNEPQNVPHYCSGCSAPLTFPNYSAGFDQGTMDQSQLSASGGHPDSTWINNMNSNHALPLATVQSQHHLEPRYAASRSTPSSHHMLPAYQTSSQQFIPHAVPAAAGTAAPLSWTLSQGTDSGFGTSMRSATGMDECEPAGDDVMSSYMGFEEDVSEDEDTVDDESIL